MRLLASELHCEVVEWINPAHSTQPFDPSSPHSDSLFSVFKVLCIYASCLRTAQFLRRTFCFALSGILPSSSAVGRPLCGRLSSSRLSHQISFSLCCDRICFLLIFSVQDMPNFAFKPELAAAFHETLRFDLVPVFSRSDGEPREFSRASQFPLVIIHSDQSSNRFLFDA